MVMGSPAARTTGQGCSWVGLRWDARRRTLPRSLPNHEWCVSPHCFLGFPSVSLRSVNRCSLGTAPPAAPRRVLPRLRLGLASLGQSVLARHGAALRRAAATPCAFSASLGLASLGQSVLARHGAAC